MKELLLALNQYLESVNSGSNWEQIKATFLIIGVIFVIRWIINWILGTTKLDDIVEELKEIKEILKQNIK